MWAANTAITLGMLGGFSGFQVPEFSLPSFTMKRDPDSPKVTKFIDKNLSDTIRIEGNEAWCEKQSTSLHINTNPSSPTAYESKLFYHLEGVSVTRRQLPLEPNDRVNKVDFRIQLSILSTSYRMRTENDNWTDSKNGSPLSLNFIIESVRGKLFWNNLSTQGIQAS